MQFRNFSVSAILALAAYAPQVLADYWDVSTYSDIGCNTQIGDWEDDVASGCVSLSGFTVNAESIKFTGDIGGCGWSVFVFSDDNCDGTTESVYEIEDLNSDQCYGVTLGEFDGWKSWRVDANPC